MAFAREQKKQAYQKLSPEVQDFIMSSETTELIGRLLQEAGLSENEEISADSEILYSLYGLQPLSTAIENIAKLTNRNPENFSNLRMKLEDNIFNKIQKQNSVNYSDDRSTTTPQPPKPEQPRSRMAPVGFEEAILNQAKAMRPARPTGETGGIKNNEYGIGDRKENSQYKMHDYKPNTDPYREPLE